MNEHGGLSGPSPAQVTPKHYGTSYDDRYRWNSYWHQLETIGSLAPRSVVEIGPGAGLLTWYMRKRMGLRVVTVDHDPAVSPDIVASVERLQFPDLGFRPDMIVAFQVLEHLPFERLGNIAERLGSVAERHVVVSLPQVGHWLQINWRIWRFEGGVAKKLHGPRRWRFDGQHYWEVGALGTGRRAVRRALGAAGTLEQERVYHGNAYHREYVLSVPRSARAQA